MNLITEPFGPAIVTYRGITLHARGGVAYQPTSDAFAIDSDVHGTIGQRALDNAVAVTLTPIGVWTSAALAVLFRLASQQVGTLLTPRYDVDTVDDSADTLTFLGSDKPRTGCPVRIGLVGAGTLPAGLSADTLYYFNADDDTLHTSAANAAAGTSAVDITDTGTGEFAVIEQEPLVIHGTDNRRLTLHNAAIVTPPSVTLGATQAPFGPMTFAGFIKNGAARTDANSLYTIDRAVFADSAPTVSEIPTQEYSAAWGSSPWDSFKFRGPVTFTPQVGTSPIGDDGVGTVGLMLNNLTMTASGIPHGFTTAQLADILGMQGTGAGRGVSKARAALVVTGTGVYVSLANAGAVGLPQTFSATEPRAGALAWVAARTPGSAPFTIATAAP